jgi:hypothetical protein
MKRPIVVIDFSDELARQLTSERVENLIREFIKTEACVDSKSASQLLSITPDEFRRKHSKRLPMVQLGSGSQGNRYRIKDIIAYRDKHTVFPKS